MKVVQLYWIYELGYSLTNGCSRKHPAVWIVKIALDLRQVEHGVIWWSGQELSQMFLKVYREGSEMSLSLGAVGCCYNRHFRNCRLAGGLEGIKCGEVEGYFQPCTHHWLNFQCVYTSVVKILDATKQVINGTGGTHENYFYPWQQGCRFWWGPSRHSDQGDCCASGAAEFQMYPWLTCRPMRHQLCIHCCLCWKISLRWDCTWGITSHLTFHGCH